MLRILLARFLLFISFILTQLQYQIRIQKQETKFEYDLLKFIDDNNISVLTSADQFSQIILDNFRWKAEKSILGISLDYAKNPLVFLYDKKDDCDGFALFCETVLKKVGFKDVFRLYVKTKNMRGHVVCVAKMSDGFYYGFGNWRSFPFSSHELSDMSKTIAFKIGCKLDFALKYSDFTFIDQYCE